jgi:hypothetical protein
MSKRPLKPEEVARAAAEGVAIALRTRDAEFRGPYHIICGYPPNDDIGIMFQVTLEADETGAMRAGAMEQQALG